jgi:hypothetical protein
MGQVTLRISTEQDEAQMVIRLDGRLAGPWAKELVRIWTEKSTELGQRKAAVDLRNVTYVDEQGKSALRDIYEQSHAQLIASTPWTRYLAEEVMRKSF